MTEQPRQWSSGEWLSELLLRRGPDAVRIVQTIARRLSPLECIKWQGSSQRRGDGATLWPWIVVDEQHILPPIGFRLDGMVEVPFEWMNSAPFDEPDKRSTLAQLLQSIQGVVVPQTAGWPSFGLRALDSEDACDRIVDVFRWFIGACQRGKPAAAKSAARETSGFEGDVVRWKLSFLVDDALKSSAYGRYRLGPLRRWLSDGLKLSTASINAIPVKSAAEFERHIAQHPRGTRYSVGLVVLVENDEAAEIERMCRSVVGDDRYFSCIAICRREAGEPWNIKTVIRPSDCQLVESLERAFESQIASPLEVQRQRSRVRSQISPTSNSARGRPTHALDRMRDVANRLNVEQDWLREVLWLLSDRRGLVLYGPPGCGKTFMAMAIAELIQPDPKFRAVVPLHPSIRHEALMGAESPVRDLVERIGEDRRGVVVLDDLTRVDAPAVLGELSFMMEHRDTVLATEDPFLLPERLLFISTMNTADMPLDHLDQAMRRRFHFVGLFPGEAPLDCVLRRFLENRNPEISWVADVLDEANRRLGDRYRAIGPSHFMRKSLDEQGVERIWRYSIMPLLEARFRDEPGRLAEFEFARLRATVEGTGIPRATPPAPTRAASTVRRPSAAPPRAVPVARVGMTKVPARSG